MRRTTGRYYIHNNLATMREKALPTIKCQRVIDSTKGERERNIRKNVRPSFQTE